MPVDPQKRALKSTPAELDAAALITPEDVARAQASAPAVIQPYITATPDPKDDAAP